jgi:hypothetical protein
VGMTYLCSQCNSTAKPIYTGRVLSPQVGVITYELCSSECLEAFYKEIVNAIMKREVL